MRTPYIKLAGINASGPLWVMPDAIVWMQRDGDNEGVVGFTRIGTPSASFDVMETPEEIHHLINVANGEGSGGEYDR